MKIHVIQLYIDPETEYPFNWRFQVRMSKELSSMVTPSQKYLTKYGRTFDLIFYMSAKKDLKDNDIMGPGVYRKDKDVEYSVFLPADVINRSRNVPESALTFFLKGVCSVLESLEIDTSKIVARQQSLIKDICADPELFWDDSPGGSA